MNKENDKNEKNINDIVNYLDNIKLIFERLLKDVYLYNENLSEFVLYYQKYDKNNEIMSNIMIKKLKIISELFYKSVINHLSIINSDHGFGDRLIKPVKEQEQINVIKYCGIKKLYGEKYIQTTINVATIDNMTIKKIFDTEKNNVENCTQKSIIGYKLNIGKMEYFFDENYEICIKSINEIIDEKKNILENIENSLATNIDFIQKYKNAFLTNIK
jgi:hypothetical protein